MTTRTKICIDRVLPRNLMRLQPTRRGPDRVVRAINPIGTTWMNGSTLSVRFIGGTAAQRAIAREQAGWWSQVANLKFQFKNLGFLDGGTAAHEFGHAIGLAHEHQSPSGGIVWNEEVVIREMAKSPNFWDADTTRHNILRKYAVSQINGTAFDPDSIMLYFFPAEWTRNGVGTEANEVLSRLDREFVAGAKMYPGGGATVATAKVLEVNAKRRTQASIGKAGEEDIFNFTADRDGRYVIDTRGPTDVVMKLFGPGSETALIAEDDDSGVETNARITANLVAGDYFVQVRHYNTRSGMGNYSVKVRRV